MVLADEPRCYEWLQFTTQIDGLCCSKDFVGGQALALVFRTHEKIENVSIKKYMSSTTSSFQAKLSFLHSLENAETASFEGPSNKELASVEPAHDDREQILLHEVVQIRHIRQSVVAAC